MPTKVESFARPSPGNRWWRPAGLDGTEVAFTSHRRYSFPKHFHEEYVIALMVRGVEKLSYAGSNDLAPEGSLILVNPGQVHENGSVDDNGFAYRTLYAPVAIVERILIDAGVPTKPLPAFMEAVVFDADVSSLLRQLHAAVECGEPSIRLQTLLTLGLALLFRRHAGVPLPDECPQPSGRTIALVKEYLDAHFDHKVSLSDLSRLVNLSPYHLAHLFSAAVGLPPCRYLIQRRLLHALKRLRQGASISLAALEAGFVDQSHLSRHFKRILGITPGQFQTNRKIIQDRPGR